MAIAQVPAVAPLVFADVDPNWVPTPFNHQQPLLPLAPPYIPKRLSCFIITQNPSASPHIINSHATLRPQAKAAEKLKLKEEKKAAKLAKKVSAAPTYRLDGVETVVPLEKEMRAPNQKRIQIF